MECHISHRNTALVPMHHPKRIVHKNVTQPCQLSSKVVRVQNITTMEPSVLQQEDLCVCVDGVIEWEVCL